MTDMSHLFSEVRRVERPATRIHNGKPTPFELSCSIEPPSTSNTETLQPSLNLRLPEDLRELWAHCSGIRLFTDEKYGQWGLVIWSPDVALQKTRQEENARPEEYRPGDLIVGEFLGDADLLVVRCAPNAPDFGAVVVSLPMDPRSDWETVSASIRLFLTRFVEEEGAKFWE
jgi:hypothetical protein